MRSHFLQLIFATLLLAGPFHVMAEPEQAVAGTEPAVQEQNNSAINLNTADAQTLQQSLAGVGEVKASEIVNHRDAHGDFVSVDELLEVKGIGTSIIDKNRDKLIVD
ncbi:conserved exported protein of unknown function [Pseudomonas marincola]|uniref:Competence protein ComEA n=1 Tax=Pseudomonas marincola TaxID=437900 RepID=A0A653E778_9PSED|nr:ComEA family DNA-binding protein [Pseudomonas marincola]CAE6909148.1 conserved exported protein of unknown function [Pseudomonas marincola]